MIHCNDRTNACQAQSTIHEVLCIDYSWLEVGMYRAGFEADSHAHNSR